jgi:hypothetical protein
MEKLLTLSLCFSFFVAVIIVGRRSHAEAIQNPVSGPESLQHVTKQSTQDGLSELSENAKIQLNALMLEKQSRTPVQQKIDSQLLTAAKMNRGQVVAPALATMQTDVAYDKDGRAEVDISAEVTDNLLETIRALGGEVVNSYPQFNAVRANLAPENLETIASLPEVRMISRGAKAEVSRISSTSSSQTETSVDARANRIKDRLSKAFPGVLSAHSVTSNSALVSSGLIAPLVGSVTSEGDVTHTADQARSSFGVTGAGIKIGVISDSVDFLSDSQASGNLDAVTVLSGRSGVPGTGEGTAMLEIVHDLAPGAQLFFSTGNGGPAAFAQNILDLRAAGCNIIVDDLEYLNESPFQDAVVAQAVNTVTADGALYFSSAGNSGNIDDLTSSVWEGDFVDGGPISYNGTTLGNANRFFAPSIIFNQTFVPSNQDPIQNAFLFWSDPLAGSSNDYDLYIVNSSGTIVRFSNNTQNGTQDPIENTSITDGEHVLVVKFGGANRYLHINVGRGVLSYATSGRTKGHSAAVNALSVAAVKAGTSYPNAFTGGDANPVETFSSDGPRRVFYNADGTAITPGNLSATGGAVRAKPDITAADGVRTSVTGFAHFFGTSAAAPHGAAIAGLVLSFNPSLTSAQVRTALTSTTLDIEGTGPDRDSGAGIVMAHRAVQVVATCPATSILPGQTINGSLTTSDCVFSGTTRRVDVYSFSGTIGQQIAITMSSSAFDTYLYLIDADSNTLASDDDGGGGTNSRIPSNTGFFTLPATGTYTIYATSFFEGSMGSYTLNLTSSNCTFSLNPTSQIFISSASAGSFSVVTSANCSWTATSNVSWLMTSSRGTGNGTVDFSVAANTGNSRTGNIYIQGQTFTVFQSAGNGNGCPSTTIAIGQTINATLTTGCVFTGTSRYVDPYNFTGNAGQQIVIAMSSTAFDTFLFLDNPNNQTIAQNDDGGGGTNSRIPANAGFFTLPTSGTYRIFATSFSADGITGSTGPYTISLLSTTSCSYSTNSTSQNIAAAGGNNSFSIFATTGCTWTALSNAGWITTNSSGSGNGTVNYSVALNTGAARTGTISVGGQLFTVTQGAGGSAPANNNFANAQVITGSSGTVTGSNVGATKESGEPNHAGFSGGASVWYRWQAPASGAVSFVTAGSDFDTLLAAYTGSSVNSLTAVAGNDDFNGTLQSGITFTAQSGVTYYLAVDGFGGATGSIMFAWNMTAPSSPMIFVEQGTNRAAALDSVTWLRGPFKVADLFNFSGDHHTRVVLFTSELGLTQPDSSQLAVRAAGVALTVESVGPVVGVSGMSASYIVVRLPDGLPTGDLPLVVTLRGLASVNSPTLAIAP